MSLLSRGNDEQYVNDLIKPNLKRAEANHIRNALCRKSENKYSPYCRIMKNRYTRYLYIDHAKIVIAGYIRLTESDFSIAIPTDITKLCEKYAFVYQDGMIQLSHKISIILKKANQKSITIPLLKRIISRLTQNLQENEIEIYCNELIKLKLVEKVEMKVNVTQYIHLLGIRPKKLNQLYTMNETFSSIY